MLKLLDIKKTYDIGDMQVEALKGISVEFRKSEFVSILGQSGCGKTTLLNIIGGLDHYSSGDLVIDGVSTKTYKDSDWDTYRNHKIGFVFQSYNLISHQTVLSNVELALTLSGVGKAERKRRAMEALEKVGLKDQANKKPNQMSGGQMQRVAIARALVNDPDILLADEPTGALDSETSIQIMEILKEISKEKLIIMVTHNPELAEKYSTRIIKLLDGLIIDDTNPYTAENLPEQTPKKKKEKHDKTKSMSFMTALQLSLNNLMTKKGRTFMTSFAGSIGIIGIALILAISNGVNVYVKGVEADALSSYPLTIESATMDMSGLITAMMSMKKDDVSHGDDSAYSNDMMANMLKTFASQVVVNDLKTFKKHIENPNNGFKDLVSDIKYLYTTELNIYNKDVSKGPVQVHPSSVFESLFSSVQGSGGSVPGASSSMMKLDVWTELMSNKKLLENQYDVLYGKIPETYNEAVIILDKNNEISDYTLYSLGIKDQAELKEMMKKMMMGQEIPEVDQSKYTYEYLCSLVFKVLPTTDYYEFNSEENRWIDRSGDSEYIRNLISDNSRGIDIKIVGVIRPSESAAGGSSAGGVVGYRSDLMTNLIGMVNESDIVKDQKSRQDTDIFTGKKFTDNAEISEEIIQAFLMSLSDEERQAFLAMPEDEKAMLLMQYVQQNGIKLEAASTYKDNLDLLGVADLDDPFAINIYPVDFESKEKIKDKIDEYNKGINKDEQLQYTDYISVMMSSVTDIISSISYILIAFVAISLIVSSIMIGIITYISVLERTKEIGILRSIGASKKDISRVFNAETLIVGFVAGIIGIIVTLILTVPINMLVLSLAGINNIASLPWIGAAVLVVISMCLTLIAGLLPSRVASKKDPVVALRTE